MKVHYLCHPPNETNGFVYAAELPNGYYAPGMFCVEASDASGNLAESFEFPARLGKRLITTNLVQVATRTYAVDIEELAVKLFFKLVSLDRKSRYEGRSSDRFSGLPLFRAQPANTQRLEQVCVNHDFYFVGFGYDLETPQNEG